MGIQLSYCNGADLIRPDMWLGPGNWDGQYSIRINDQYPICFCFEDGEASRVELVDYH